MSTKPNVKVREETKNKIVEISKNLDMTQTDLIDKAIDNYIDRRNQFDVMVDTYMDINDLITEYKEDLPHEFAVEMLEILERRNNKFQY